MVTRGLIMSNKFRSFQCPCCGYDVYVCDWLEVELKVKEEVLYFCTMCDSYLYVSEVDNNLTAIEDDQQGG